MIQVKFHGFPDGRMEMRLSGHAGSAPKGQDLVCAGVSVLVYTAAQNIQEAFLRGKLQSEPVTFLKEGCAVISAKPRTRYRASVGAVFRTVRGGMEMLARNFPAYVQLRGEI